MYIAIKIFLCSITIISNYNSTKNGTRKLFNNAEAEILFKSFIRRI